MDDLKILLVEDSQLTQKTVVGLFSELKCEVQVAETAEEALGYLKGGYVPDLIILDFKLPGQKKGPEFFRDLSMDVKWKNIPVVPFTSQWSSSWMDKNLATEWMASAMVRKGLGSELDQVISKGTIGEHVKNVPQELVLSVGEALKRSGKTLPPEFKYALDYIRANPKS
jgi:CheY-like chemotaxis protein